MKILLSAVVLSLAYWVCPISHGGTGSRTVEGAWVAINPDTTGNTAKFLRGDRTWATAGGGSAKQVIAGQSGHWSAAFNPGFLPLNAYFNQTTTSSVTDFSGVTSAPYTFSIAGTLKNFYLAEDVAPTGGHDTIKVYKNGTAQTMKIVITNTATTGSDAVNTVSVAVGDKFYLSGTAGSTDNGTAATWSFEFDPN